MLVEPALPKLQLLQFIEPIHYFIEHYGEELSITDSILFTQMLSILKTSYRRNPSLRHFYDVRVAGALTKLCRDAMPSMQREISEIYQAYSWVSKERFPLSLQREIVESLLFSCREILLKHLKSADPTSRGIATRCLQYNLAALSNYVADGYEIVEIVRQD